MTTELKWYNYNRQKPTVGTKVLFGAYNIHSKDITAAGMSYMLTGEHHDRMWQTLDNKFFSKKYYNFWARI